MKRTAGRPLPAGRMDPTSARDFGIGLSVASVLLMGLAISWLAAAILAISIVYYAVIYTIWLKPRTPQNIVIGGGAGAFPPLIGWVAATGHITGLRNLTYYFNSYTTITDHTPALLSTMDSLERVTFDTCHGLTNAGVAQLARLPKLREVSASGRGITPDVRNAFPIRVRVTAGS